MRSLSVRLPPHPRTAARARYVLDWLEQHPYSAQRVRFHAVDDAEQVDVDLGVLTGKTAWLSAPPHAPKLAQTLSALPPARVRSGAEWVYGLGPRRADRLRSATGTYAFDWVATLFAWLARWEEQAGHRASASPPPPSAQWLVRHRLEREPRADRLAAALLAEWGLPVQLEASRVQLTHDLDHVRCFAQPWAPLRHAAYVARRGAGPRALGPMLSSAVSSWTGRSSDPFDNPDRTLGAGGAVLFLLLGRHVRRDGGRDRSDARLRPWIEAARAAGYQLGLHPSFTTPEHPERIIAERERFVRLVGEPPRLSRQHFLRWSWSRTPDALTEAGIETDSTLGFRDRLGFRCGTSFPYRLYDFTREAAGELTERPLAAMDTAWLEANDYDAEACAADWADFTTRNDAGADLVLNVHNSTFIHADLAGIDLAAWYRFAGDRS